MSNVVALLPKNQRRKADSLSQEDLFQMGLVKLANESFETKGDGFGHLLVYNCVEKSTQTRQTGTILKFRRK